MASNRLEQAYSFHSKLSLSQMEARLNAGWPSFWIERDSHWKPDSISGALTSEASARIFEHGIEFYIVNVGFRPNPSGDAEEQANRARDRLLNDALPLLEASDLKVSEPVD